MTELIKDSESDILTASDSPGHVYQNTPVLTCFALMREFNQRRQSRTGIGMYDVKAWINTAVMKRRWNKSVLGMVLSIT